MRHPRQAGHDQCVFILLCGEGEGGGVPVLALSSHPVMSSCATAARAIMTAVGFWICISRSSTLPSLVSLMSGRAIAGAQAAGRLAPRGCSVWVCCAPGSPRVRRRRPAHAQHGWVFPLQRGLIEVTSNTGSAWHEGAPGACTSPCCCKCTRCAACAARQTGHASVGSCCSAPGRVRSPQHMHTNLFHAPAHLLRRLQAS